MKKKLLFIIGCLAVVSFAGCGQESMQENETYAYSPSEEESEVSVLAEESDTREQESTSEIEGYEYQVPIEEIDDYESEAEPALESENNEEPIEPVLQAIRSNSPRFSSDWAITSTHLFFPAAGALIRIPLDDITQSERVEIPAGGQFIGACEDYLIMSRGGWVSALGRFRTDTYRVSLSTFEAEHLDTGYYTTMPTFHAPSNSLLFAHIYFETEEESDEDTWLFERTARIEHLQLDTGDRNTLIEFVVESHAGGFIEWMSVIDGAVFVISDFFAADWGSDFIFVDANLNARRIWGVDREPVTPLRTSEATIGDWILYLDGENPWRNLRLYKRDATESILLRDDVYFDILYHTGNVHPESNTLFALVADTNYTENFEFIKLAEDGSTAKVIASGGHGHNLWMGMERLSDTYIVMFMQYNAFWIEGHILAFYCTATGKFR